MWQPRGLDYSLYTVLSRHHTRANDFSLSFIARQEDAAAGDLSRFVSSATIAAGPANDTVALSTGPVLLTETVAEEDRGESKAEGNAIDLSVRWQNSRVCTPQSAIVALHHQKDPTAAGFPLFQNGIGMGDGVREKVVAGMFRSYLPKAMEPSVAEDLTHIHERQAQIQEKQGEVVEFQEEMQLQQGRQGCLPEQRRHQHQKQMQQAQLHPQKEQERQEQDPHQPRNREPPLPAYFGHMSSWLPCADDVTGGGTAREPHRRTSLDMKREHTTRLGDGQLSTSETLEIPGEAKACSSSSFSPPLCPSRLAEPLCSSGRHIAESNITAAAVFCPTEGCPCGAAEKIRTDSSIAFAAPEVPPPVVAIKSTASTTSESAAKETNTEPLIRLASTPAVPSFRVLILFGSTSGVSAAVAFSIFHTFVHRLLSSFNRLQGGGYSAERSTTYSLGPGSPVAAMTPHQTSLFLSASSEEASASSTLATASSSSSRDGGGVVRPAFSRSEDAPADSNEEKDSPEDTAARQSEGDHNTSVEAEELFLNCQSQQNMTYTSRLASTSRRGRSGKTFIDTNNNMHHETSTGKESGGGLKNETTHRQQHQLKHPRQRQRRQQEKVGERGKRKSHADCTEMSQKVKEICSQRQRQEGQQRSNAQRQKQQQDEQQVSPQNDAGLRRKSSCREEDQSLTKAGARCTFPGGPELILEKREAAAQAAEVATMGLKAAAAIASAALKSGAQRDAACRAAAASSAAREHYKEESKTWFLDEIQVGRVGVYIQSMRYFTFEDLLEFAEESRVASSAGTAPAAAFREAADACAGGRMSCRTEIVTDSAASSFPGAMDADAGADAERASGCLCGSSVDSAVVNDLQNDIHNSAFVRSSGCGVSLYSIAKAAAAESSRTSGDDDLSSTPHTLILYCISTHMGGAPPESAASFYSEVLEAADDFRVNRGSLRGCCVAGVGCGSTDYPQSTYCRPARQLMTPLHRLGARVLMQQPLLLLTDTSAAATTEMKLAKWRQQLVQQVERLLQANDEKDVQQLLQAAKKGAFFPRQKQNQQHHRQQLQQPHRSQWLEGDYEACRDTTGACSATLTEVAKLKEVGNSRLPQPHAVAVSNSVSTNNGIASQNTLQDFLSMNDSSYISESDEQSDDTYDTADGDDDDDDDVNSRSLAGEASFAKDKRVNPRLKRRMPTFTGIGSNICGGSGDDDVEDVVGAETLTEDGVESDAENNSSLQVERLQADKSQVTQRRERDQLCGKQADQEPYSQKTDEKERHHEASEHASAGEVRRKRQQRRGNKRQTERTQERMIKPRHAEQLSKEGYRLIGSHSAVKLCRWTKSQLRGRGGCYKHTFYGITSSQCMEMTPSLACANKCIFCWRHHKNPVGTSWRWQMDDAGFVVNEAITQHFKAIKELKGMAEVKQDRLDAARGNIRHCALSLVGEPIMYPRIDALVKLLHEKCISTFLVTNAQFPDALASLPPVTQLYLSVDAASAGDLKALDQPLFSDYWARFIKCMEILRSKRQRTVYRLTLVAGYNMPDLATLGRTQSEAQSGAHQAGRQQGGIIAHPSSDKSQLSHTCHPPLTEHVTLEKADSRSHGGTSSSACPCSDAAARLTMSPATSVRTFYFPTAAPTTGVSATFKSKLEVETEDCSRTVERDRDQPFTGRSATDYAALVLKGLPDFIEVKAVTYAGTSKHSKITMKNIPWHDQVIAFCKDLCAALPKGVYELACAHRHSCCVLIAKTEYKKNGQWHTWINYDRFHELASTGRADFAGTDYCAPTPDWAIFGHAAAGFSPFEARIYTKGKQKRLQASVATAEICQA